MNDLFQEILVSKKPTMKNGLIKFVLILFTVLFFAAGLIIHPLFLLAGVGMIFVDMWQIPRQSVEYEYSYVNGDLDIDEIFSKKSRKHLVSYHMHDVEVFAPAKSSHLDSYQNLPVTDYTSGTQEDRDKAWAFVIGSNGKREKVLFSPNENIIKDVRMRVPSKTFMM